MSAGNSYTNRSPSSGAKEATPFLLLLTLLVLLCPAVPAAAKRQRDLMVEGTLAKVEPSKITVYSAQGDDFTIVCREDFRETVAPGSKVTAYYTVKEGINTLTWLEYPPQSFFASPEEIGRSFKKIAILPEYGVPDSEGLVDRIGDYLSDNLGWYVAPAMLGEEVSRQMQLSHSTLEDIDPATGEFDMETLLKLHHAVVKRLATEARVDGVLEVRVVPVKAQVLDNYANWDGVKEDIAGKAVRGLSRLTGFPQNGEVPASTVIMKLWNSQGKLLWSCRRGFASLVLHVGLGNDFANRPLTEVYQNQAGVSRWLADTLGTWAPPKKSPTMAATPGSARH